MQGIVLLNMVISDLYNGVSSDVRKLDDDTKLFRVICLQKNAGLYEISKRAKKTPKNKRQIKFCIAKCKIEEKTIPVSYTNDVH